jgi:hypothetical protein
MGWAKQLTKCPLFMLGEDTEYCLLIDAELAEADQDIGCKADEIGESRSPLEGNQGPVGALYGPSSSI